MSNIDGKDTKPQDELDEPWLLNYNFPENWFHFLDLSPPWNSPPPRGILQGVTGLYNYKIPTDSQFAQCNKVNGLSLWDQNGWWQCLFPRDIIRQRVNKVYHDDTKSIDLNRFVSKETVANDPTALSKYFNDYTKYLLWKSEQNKTLSTNSSLLLSSSSSDSDQKGDNKQSWLPVDKVTTPEDIMQTGWIDGEPNERQGKQKIIGRSQYMTYDSSNKNMFGKDNNNPSTKEVITTKTYYDDGSCVVKETEKIIPSDGGEPIINERERVIKEKPSSSWF